MALPYAFGTTYFVVAGGQGTSSISLSTTEGGAPIAVTTPGGVEAAGGLFATTIAVADASLTAGAGGTQGTYEDVEPTTSGSGTGAKATVVIGAGGTVESVTYTTPGSGYANDDTNTFNVGGLTTASVHTVATAQLETNYSDTPDAHVKIKFSDFTILCNVTEYSLDLSRAEITTTTLDCSCTADASAIANVETSAPGLMSGSGSITVLFTTDQRSTSQRLFQASIAAQQTGAMLRLYQSVEWDADGDECDIDEAASSYFEAPVSLLGFSFTVNTTDAQTGTVNFTLAGKPTHMFTRAY